VRQRALVIGGSVGGLFAAHLLRKGGWDVAIHERAAAGLGDRGTGRVPMPVPRSPRSPAARSNTATSQPP